jgi:hypothetical protein
MNRFVLPELLYAAAAPIVVRGRPCAAVRWMLHPSLGLPRALFRVWRFEGPVRPVPVTAQRWHLATNRELITWSGGAAAAVLLKVSVPAGRRVTVRGHSRPLGSGRALVEESVTGPAADLDILLYGGPVASVTVHGLGAVSHRIYLVPLVDLINGPGWTLADTVGLPVDDSFSGTGYPLDAQGPPGALRPAMDAAIVRVANGTPDEGWPTATDRGTAVPPFTAPDPATLVLHELEEVRAHVRRLLAEVDDPREHQATRFDVPVGAPRSVHGMDAPPHWQEQAENASVPPLGALLVSAATDPFSALALGFGTTIDAVGQQVPMGPPVRVVAPTERLLLPFLMVTVSHRTAVDLPAFEELPLPDELAALCVVAAREPERPHGVTVVGVAAAATGERGVHLDPPAARDGRWLEVVRVSWDRPVTSSASGPAPTGYAVARGLGPGPLEVRLDPRTAGGWSPFVPGVDPREEAPAHVAFLEPGLPQLFPGEPSTAVYAVAATDWFGRWSGWLSADHTRARVAAQVPAVREVTVEVEDGTDGMRSGTATVELVWDWSHRSPRTITVRLLTHTDGSPPRAVWGSVLAVGGPVQADLELDFSTATPDVPPAGVELIAEESAGNLRVYRVRIPGLILGFSLHPRIRVSARARARERVGFANLGAWSPYRSVMLASPIPPPPPLVPAAMWWASLPDARGVARSTLRWEGGAPAWVVYVADETAIRRELGLPSADLEQPAAERLPALRTLSFERARRAFRRLAGPLTAASLPIELPRGSQLIHFYGIAPVSGTGVEGPLPASANEYFAVAAVRRLAPETPIVIARDRGGVVQLTVEVPETRVPVDRIAIHRAPTIAAAAFEFPGPPVAVLERAAGVRSGERIRFGFEDLSPGRAWEAVYYRAVAWGATDLAAGVYGGASPTSRAVEVVVTSPAPPVLADLRIEELAEAPGHRLVSFVTDATIARTVRGAHVFAVQTVNSNATVGVRRVAADALPLLDGPLPGPGAQPGIFRHHPTEPRAGRIHAWIPAHAVAVTVEVGDPAGRTSRESWTAP